MKEQLTNNVSIKYQLTVQLMDVTGIADGFAVLLQNQLSNLLIVTGTADDQLWPMIQKKLEVLNKAGLTKDNFQVRDYELE